MRKSVRCYFLFIHVLLLLVLLKTDFAGRAMCKLGLRQKHKSDFYQEMVVHLERQDAHVPKESVIVLGDSIIQGLCVSSLSEKCQNFGIGTDTTDGLLKRISRYQSVQNARAILLYIGGNDIGVFDNKRSLENIKSIIKIIPERTPIYICSILPVDERISKKKTNLEIRELNKEIKNLCSEIDNVFFLSISSCFEDSEGNLKKTFHSGDGVHLGQQGYLQMIISLGNSLGWCNEKLPD